MLLFAYLYSLGEKEEIPLGVLARKEYVNYYDKLLSASLGQNSTDRIRMAEVQRHRPGWVIST